LALSVVLVDVHVYERLGQHEVPHGLQLSVEYLDNEMSATDGFLETPTAKKLGLEILWNDPEQLWYFATLAEKLNLRVRRGKHTGVYANPVFILGFH